MEYLPLENEDLTEDEQEGVDNVMGMLQSNSAFESLWSSL